VLDRFTRSLSAPVLQGALTYIRPPQSGDWAAWARLRAESREFLKPWEPIWPADALTRAAFRRRLRRHAREARDDSGYAFLIFRRLDDVLLGGITLSNVRRGVTQSCSVGYWIGKRHARQGYMHDALKLVIAYVFDEMRLHRLEAACVPSNEPSRAVLRSAGFREEGLAREYLCIDGVWRDHVLHAMLASDHRPR